MQSLLEKAKPLISHVFLRAILALVVSTASIIGGVYFIVDMSLRGTEKSIDTVNSRISGIESRIESSNRDLSEKISQAKSDVSNIIELNFRYMKLEMLKEFKETKKEIRKTSIEIDLRTPSEIADAGIKPVYRKISYGDITLELPTDPTAKKLIDAIMEIRDASIYSRFDENAPFAVMGRIPPSSELSRAVGFLYSLGAANEADGQNPITAASLAANRGRTSNECFTMKYEDKSIEINLKNTARLGRDGFVCITGEVALQRE